MSFQQLSSYLDKFKNIIPPDDFLKTCVVEIVKNELGIELEKKSIEISKGVIYIKSDPIIKNEIFLKRGLFLKKINEISKGRVIKDIR